MIKNVLLIDDDHFCNRLNSFVLEQHGSIGSVNMYESAIDALKYLHKVAQTENHESFPDVILLDLHMSYMDGWEFLDNFAGISPLSTTKTNIFILTSSIQGSDREKALMREDVAGYIEKPFTDAELDYVIAHCQAHQPL